jgi:hypothetical protein
MFYDNTLSQAIISNTKGIPDSVGNAPIHCRLAAGPNGYNKQTVNGSVGLKKHLDTISLTINQRK